MKNILSALFVLITTMAYSQIDYQQKIEIGYIQYKYNTEQVDPGPNWKGYNLHGENGIDLNVINGLLFKKKIFAGIGAGYLNFEGINGFSIFTDLQYSPFKTKLTLFLNLKIGYNHIWNQYKNGTGSTLINPGLGLDYRLTEKINIYLQSGYLMTQQSLLIPIRMGFRF
ncbi:MAG: hypothetical protein N4A59_08455 [Marinifilum sp.]|jgi:hypothetical protein|nr:hypothetical protein [Marinifilum sp.]